MSVTIIVVSPAFRDGKRKHDHFDAFISDTGELICSVTRQPLLDGARELLSRGYDPKGKISMVWAHRPELVSMSATIGVAAQYDVMGDRLVKRKPVRPPTRHRNPS